MRRGFRLLEKWQGGHLERKMYDLGWTETLKKTGDNVVKTARDTVSHVSDTATQETIGKAWAALDHSIKLREASQHPVDITVSVSLGPLQVTLSCPDVKDFDKD